METICKKWQILFSRKNKKNITNLLSVEFAQRVMKSKENEMKSNINLIMTNQINQIKPDASVSEH